MMGVGNVIKFQAEVSRGFSRALARVYYLKVISDCS